MCCHACGTAPDGIIKAEFANKLGIFTHPSHSTLAFLTANRYTILSSEEMASGKSPELPDYDIGGITMKTLNAIVKVLAVLAAVAGAIYVIAAYGDKIVAWAKRVIGCCPWDEGMEEEEAPAEEAPETETPVEEAPVEEAPAEEAPAAEEVPAVEDNAPVASEEDFEG